MNRRGFFKSLATMAGIIAIDPEQLLWTKTKTIFIPPAATVDGITWDMINEKVMRHMVPRLIDNVYKVNPVFAALRKPGRQILHGGTQLNCPIRPMVQDQVQSFSASLERQISSAVREIENGMGLRSRASQGNFSPELHSTYERAMHRAAAEGSSVMVLSMPGITEID